MFEFKGKGRRPVLDDDKSKEVQWVEVGPVTSSAVGDTLHDGSWFVENHGAGRIGLNDGTVVDAQKITLVYWMGRTLNSVWTK